MKILQINAFHYLKGGSETVYFNTSRLLREHGHQVVNFALKWPENQDSPYSRYFPESKETRTGPLRPLKNIVTYFYHSQAARNLEKLIEAEKPEIAQIHLIWGQLSPSILRVLKKHGIPAVLTAHDYRMICPASVCVNGKGEVCRMCEGKKFYKCIANSCCKGSRLLSVMMAAEQYTRNLFLHPARLASGVIYVSDFSRRMHQEYMPALRNLPSACIYNFTFPKTPNLSKQEKYFLYFGRLSKEKGLPTLIEAAAKFPGIKLKIAGTGPLADSLQEEVGAKELRNIEFLGYKSGEELAALVRNAYFSILPSECYENNPLSIIESYAAGTPVLGARIGGIPEIISEGTTGFIFSSADASSLIEAIDKAIGLTDEQYSLMQKNSLQFAQKHFSPEAYYSSLINFFTSLLTENA